MTALVDAAWPVRTERLLLRPATEADTGAVWAYRRQEDVSRWLTRAPATEEAFRPTFVAALPDTLVVEHAGAVVGDLMVRVEDAWAQAEVAERAQGVQAELGWVLDPDHTGKGFATEAVRAAIGLCFTQLGLRRVHAGCFAANEPSWRLMERIGMRREIAGVRDSLHRSGEWLDGYDYALLADEWTG